MEISEDKLEELRELFEDDAHSWHYARVEVMENILPKLFKPKFEVGKYYKINDLGYMSYMKVLKIEDEEIIGYGLDGDLNFWDDDQPWFSITDDVVFTEITKEEFLEQIKKYAVEVLGFKKGVFYKAVGGNTRIVKDTPKQFYDLEALHCGCGQGLIFEEGKFAEIIEQPKAMHIKVGKTEYWHPTMQLRWKAYNPYSSKVLQQRWVEEKTGKEEWKEIKTV